MGNLTAQHFDEPGDAGMVFDLDIGEPEAPQRLVTSALPRRAAA